MKLLLDTCEVLRFFEGSPELDPRYQKAFADPANVLFMSTASDWEISIKYGLGKLSLATAPAVFLPEARARLRIVSLPVLDTPALKVCDLPPFHKDPFDRLLVSQAICHQLVLASSDPLIRQYPVSLL